VNGDVLSLTIQRLSDGPIQGASIVMILATTDTTRRFPHGNAWLGFVAN